MGFDVQINKTVFFFTQVHKTTVRDSFDWITLEQY